MNTAPGLRAALIAAAGLLGACAGPVVQPAVAPRSTIQAPLPPVHDDWRVLIAAPFGSTLKQVPFPVKEVILFQGDARGGAEAEEQECYSKSGDPFLFQGAQSEDYVLCFFHERLFRIEAALRLPKDQPPEVFARWCEDWLRGRVPFTRSADVCEGQDNDSGFSAKITNDSDAAGPLITMEVYDIAARQAFERRVHEPAERPSMEQKPPP